MGGIPKNLGNLEKLFNLTLSGNKLSGYISIEVIRLSELQYIDLGANNLNKPVPREVTECAKLLNLNLGENLLEGSIPIEISKLKFLESLDLGNNMLTGEIPQEIGGMQILQTLNLSHNRLSGSIPSSFTNGLPSLTSVDISYNHLKGHFPSTKAFKEAPIEAYRNNDGSCRNKTGLTPCSPRLRNATKAKKLKKFMFLVVIPIVSALFLLLVVLGAFQVLRKSATNRENELQEINHTNLFEVWSYDGKLVHKHIMEATEHFNDKYCIGQGGYSTIYKAELPSGLIVVVKKVHSSEDGNLAYLKSFKNEICALTEIRHRNIIKLYGFCSNPQHSFLVYEFLEGGSLEKVLGKEEEALKFEWIKR